VKSGIHPKFYTDTVVKCSGGHSWITGATQKEIRTDVCSICHPFYTGEQRLIDTAGQVERFMKRQSAKEQFVTVRPAPVEDKRAKKDKRAERAPEPAPMLAVEVPVAALAPEMPAEPEMLAPAQPRAAMPATIETKPEPAPVEMPVVQEPVAMEMPAAKVSKSAKPKTAKIAKPKAAKIAKPKAAAKKPATKAPVKKPAAKKPAVKKTAAKKPKK